MRQFTLCNGSQVVNFASLSLYHYPFSMPGGESLCSHPQFFISMSADNSARCDLGATHRHPNTGNSLAPWLPATTLSIQDLCSIGTLDTLLFPYRQFVVSAGRLLRFPKDNTFLLPFRTFRDIQCVWKGAYAPIPSISSSIISATLNGLHGQQQIGRCLLILSQSSLSIVCEA